MPVSYSKSYPHNPADLKTIMTAEPMSREAHAQLLKKRTKVRRSIEDAREAAMLRDAASGYEAA